MIESMAAERERSWRDTIFAQRGTLLALPAIALGIFGKPTAQSTALGVPVALAGEAIRGWAVGYSGVTTRGDTVMAPALVTAGPYAYVRNPLYVGNFITAAGFALAFTGHNAPARRLALVAGSLGAMLGVYAVVVPHEERFLRATFGEAFDAYVDAVPRVLPRTEPAGSQRGSYDPSVIGRAESRTFVTFGAMLAVLAWKALRE
jgi:protein-S-isoprenylcysteine O-methyltransferase Ste14